MDMIAHVQRVDRNESGCSKVSHRLEKPPLGLTSQVIWGMASSWRAGRVISLQSLGQGGQIRLVDLEAG